MRTRFFVEILKEICKQEGLILEVFSHGWLLKITDPKIGSYTWTEGYNFNLNSAAAYLTLYDKVLTSTILLDAGIDCIEHFLVMKGEFREELQFEKTWEQDVYEILKKTGLPVVVKPTSGSRGLNVCLSSTGQDVLNLVSFMQSRVSVAICKYYESEFEYRFYMLDGKILICYKKIKNKYDWKHNLSLTAHAEIINFDNFANYHELEKLARQAFMALGLRAGAIDILETKEGFKVLEVNNGIMMDKFASFSSENYQLAKEIHRKMLHASTWVKLIN